jgi:hypothetical protein
LSLAEQIAGDIANIPEVLGVAFQTVAICGWLEQERPQVFSWGQVRVIVPLGEKSKVPGRSAIECRPEEVAFLAKEPRSGFEAMKDEVRVIIPERAAWRNRSPQIFPRRLRQFAFQNGNSSKRAFAPVKLMHIWRHGPRKLIHSLLAVGPDVRYIAYGYNRRLVPRTPDQQITSPPLRKDLLGIQESEPSEANEKE